MTLNTSDRKSVRAAEKAALRADRDRGEVLINLMGSAPGRAWVWSLLEAAHVFATTFSTDPIQMAFNEGQRNSGLTFLNNVMSWCPDQFILAMREANEQRRRGPGPDRAEADRDLGELPRDEEPGWDDQGPGPDEPAHHHH